MLALNPSVSTVDTERDLGVVLDSHLTMAAQVTGQRRVPFCTDQLLQLYTVLRSLSTDADKTLVQAFISTHFCTTWPTICSDSYRPFKMLQFVWLPCPTIWAYHVSLRRLHCYRLSSEWIRLAVLMFKALCDCSILFGKGLLIRCH